jgi:DNA polymerase III delta prime subunit
MFFQSLSELENIIKNSGTAIIVMNENAKIDGETFDFDSFCKKFKNVQIVEPGQAKNTSGKPIDAITIDQIRETIAKTAVKQTSDQFFFFKNAEKMQEQAQNAALKLFEEPKQNYHFILFAKNPESLLKTIRSRANSYTLKIENHLEKAPEVGPEILALSKRLLVATPDDIIDIAEELHKDREKALKVLETTIELAEKSYFKTQNEAFTRKIKGLIAAHQGVKNNGVVRLQIVANLV